MQELPKRIDDEELEILDFDDDIEELPKVEVENNQNLNNDDVSIDDIIDIDDETLKKINSQEPAFENSVISKEVSEPIQESVEELPTVEITSIITPQPKSIIEEPIKEEIQPEIKEQPLFVNEQVLDNNKIKEEKKEKHKRGKAIFVGIFIFAILMGAIIALPFLNDYVNSRSNTLGSNTNKQNNETTKENEEFESNIDVTSVLTNVKDYKNYQYQNMNDVYTKDNKNQPLSIKNNYTYLFNETKFEIEINKIVADFSYDTKDYYEKLDEKYNLYVNDITTKTYTVQNTTVEEFDNIYNMFPKMIDYLIANHKVVKEKQIIVGKEKHIDITLKVSKDILNNLSVGTERIQNKLDVSKLSVEFIEVDLLFDTKGKLYRIEFEVEDKFAYHEVIDSEVESALLKYVFTDFNKIPDIELPTL